MFGPSYIRHLPEEGQAFFPLVHQGAAADLYVSSDDHPGVIRAAGDLQADIEQVTCQQLRLLEALGPGERSNHAVRAVRTVRPR